MRVAIAALLVLSVGSCGEPKPDKQAEPAKPHPYGATPYTDAEKAEIERRVGVTDDGSTEFRADAAVACGLALLQAENRGLVESDAVVPPPWDIRSAPTRGGQRISCKGNDGRGQFTVVVDLLCTDVNVDRCHPLVRIDR